MVRGAHFDVAGQRGETRAVVSIVGRARRLVGLMALAAASALACAEAPTPTALPEPTASPIPTDEPLLHVPGTFGTSANSTTTQFVEPAFPCGPFLFSTVEYIPEILFWTADGSDLVFSHGGNIWTVDGQGAKLQRVLRALVGAMPAEALGFQYGFYADLSPDGTRLAYTSCQFQTEYEDAAYAQSVIARHGPQWYERSLYRYQIALTGLDGGNQQRITHDGWSNHYPVWSPNGNRIAFMRASHVGGRLYTMSQDGSDVQSVSEMDLKVALVPPVWSPDGQRLAFVANEGEGIYRDQRNVYTVRLDGSDLVKVGDMGGARFPDLVTVAPSWHPDGERLAFAGFDGEELFVRTVRTDGSDLRQVWSSVPASDSSSVSQVTWSPDGSELLFVADGVYIVHPDGGALQELYTLATADYTLAAWSPDESSIAIYTTQLGRGPSPWASLVIMNRDGTDLRILVEADRRDPLRVVQPTQPEATTEPATESPTPVPAEPAATPILE